MTAKFLPITLLTISIPWIFSCGERKAEENMIDTSVPQAKKIAKELTIHGDTRIDNYYWLNERENPEVIQYLNDENAYKDSMLKHTETLQSTIYDEIVGRMKQTDVSVPYFVDGYFYFFHFGHFKRSDCFR